MHDEIGIAPDRRGEMGVAAEIEAEMAKILRRIFRLGLAAQHHFVDQPFDIAAFDPPRMRLNASGRSVPPFGSEISSVARNSRSALSFSGVGSSCTR